MVVYLRYKVHKMNNSDELIITNSIPTSDNILLLLIKGFSWEFPAYCIHVDHAYGNMVPMRTAVKSELA
jgi:hypothetical protein